MPAPSPDVRIVVMHFRQGPANGRITVFDPDDWPALETEGKFPWTTLEKILPDAQLDKYYQGEEGVEWMLLWRGRSRADVDEMDILVYVGPLGRLHSPIFYPRRSRSFRMSLVAVERAEVYGPEAGPSGQAIAGRIPPERVTWHVWPT